MLWLTVNLNCGHKTWAAGSLKGTKLVQKGTDIIVIVRSRGINKTP